MNVLVKLGGIMYVNTVQVYIYKVHTCKFFYVVFNKLEARVLSEYKRSRAHLQKQYL